MEDNKNKKLSAENKRKCIYCGKTIKKFTSSQDNPNRKVHRKCWLKHRKFEDRCYDYFFTERKNTKLKKDKKSNSVYQSIPPTHSHSPNTPPPPEPNQKDLNPVSHQEKNNQ